MSRYFAGFYGIDEDPVTGSAHCSLMPFWVDRLGRNELTGFQYSARAAWCAALFAATASCARATRSR